MHTPLGLKSVEDNVACRYRKDGLFRYLPRKAVEGLNVIVSPASYPARSTLFLEGQPAKGVFVLSVGKAKLSTSSAGGRTLILRVSEPGQLLGLASTLTGKPYEFSAEVIEPSRANFINRSDFLNFLARCDGAALKVAEHLALIQSDSMEQMRTLGLSQTAKEKLARFLLAQGSGHTQRQEVVTFRMMLTHAEVAQAIGASRETVTRLLADFQRRHFLQFRGSSIEITNRAELERLLEQ